MRGLMLLLLVVCVTSDAFLAQKWVASERSVSCLSL